MTPPLSWLDRNSVANETCCFHQLEEGTLLPTKPAASISLKMKVADSREIRIFFYLSNYRT
jgi:hypothetical protein